MIKKKTTLMHHISSKAIPLVIAETKWRTSEAALNIHLIDDFSYTLNRSIDTTLEILENCKHSFQNYF